MRGKYLKLQQHLTLDLGKSYFSETITMTI